MLIKKSLPSVIFIFVLILVALCSYRYENLLSHAPLFHFLIHQRQEAREHAKINKLNIYMVRDSQALFDCLNGPCPTKFDNYITYFNLVSDYMPNQADSYAMLGFCYSHLNQSSLAIDNYKKAIELNPRFFWSYYNLGLLSWANGNFQEASFLFKQSLLLDPRETIESILPSKLYMSILAGSKISYNIVDSLQHGYQLANDFLNKIERGDKAPANLPLRFF